MTTKDDLNSGLTTLYDAITELQDKVYTLETHFQILATIVSNTLSVDIDPQKIKITGDRVNDIDNKYLNFKDGGLDG